MPKKIIIIGGGVAGMSAAHELGERGYQVVIYEKQARYVGGKARSVDVWMNVPDPGKPLPGEHGFRFFPGFYKHIIDTMKRTPLPDGRSTADNLVDVDKLSIGGEGKPLINLFYTFPKSLKELTETLSQLFIYGPQTGLSRDDMEFYAKKIWQFATSCIERRNNEYESISWWDFLDAGKRSEAFKQYFVYGVTQATVACRPEHMSLRTAGTIGMQLLFPSRQASKHIDRILNAPTNEAWLYPWKNYLVNSLKVQFHHNAEVLGIDFDRGRVQGIRLMDTSGEIRSDQADYYIAAVPVERFDQLLDHSGALRQASPGFSGIRHLATYTRWMVGLQYYLSEDILDLPGHALLVGTPWALTAISQPQFWKGHYDVSQCGNGKVKGILSIDISEWDMPDPANGYKKARECSPEQIKDIVWDQLKKCLNIHGKTILRDDMILDWYLDEDYSYHSQGKSHHAEPLLVNHVNSWQLRPDAKVENIDNLFLASDYVRTTTNLATMEGANEAARRAVNYLLDRDHSKAPRCRLWPLEEPALLTPFRLLDYLRYEKGLPWGAPLNRLEAEANRLSSWLYQKGRSLSDYFFG